MNLLIIKEDNEGRILVGYSTTGKLILPKGFVEKHSQITKNPENTIFSIQKISKINDSVVSLFNCEEEKQGNFTLYPEGIAEETYLDINEIIEQREKFEITHLRMIIRHIRLREGNEFYPQEGRLSSTVQYTHNGRILSF